MSKFEIFRSTINSQYYFRLRADNNKIVLSSEGYISKQSSQNGIASVKVNAPYTGKYQERNSPLSYSFNLVGGNGEIIGRSESYVTASGRDHGIEVVKTEAPTAPITDLTI